MADDEIPGQLPLFDLPEAPPPPEQTPTQQLDSFSERVLGERLAQLRAANQATYTALLAAQATPDPRAVLAIRLDTLLDLTLTPAERLRFDVLFETRMAAFLEQCHAQRARAGLLAPLAAPTGQPAAGAPQLILPPR